MQYNRLGQNNIPKDNTKVKLNQSAFNELMYVHGGDLLYDLKTIDYIA